MTRSILARLALRLAALTLAPVSGFAETFDLRSDLTCEARDAVTDRLAADTRVTISGDAVNVGGQFSLDWERPGFPEREPIFLMVSFDGPVRLSGDGMYALLPDARAPFGISWDKAQTRAVIPFFGRGMPKNGSIEVEPLLSGPLTLRWSVVGHSGCAERIGPDGQGNHVINVTTAARPEIVVKDPVSEDVPDQVLVNRDGSRHLHLFNGRFRLTDAATGAEILELVGKPHFSPGGRYVVLPGADAAGIFDAVDGARVVPANDGFIWNADWSALIWSHEDSFVLQVLSGNGLSQLHNFAAGRTVRVTDNGCRVCGANQHTYKLDLENNVFISEAYNELNAHRLSEGGLVSQFRPEITSGVRVGDANRRNALRDIDRQQAVAGVALGNGLVFSDQIAVSVPFSTGFSRSDNLKNNDAVADSLNPYHRPNRQVTQVAKGGADPVNGTASGALAWRSIGADISGPTSTHVTKRLREFGLPVVAGVPVERTDVAAMLPQFDSSQHSTNAARKQAFDAHDVKVTSAYAAQWQAISAATGVDVQRFERRQYASSCSVQGEGKLLGEFETLWSWTSEGETHRLTTLRCVEGSAAFNYPTTYLFSSGLEGGVSSRETNWGTISSLDLGNPGTNIGNLCTSSIDACGFEVQVFDDTLILFSRPASAYAVIDLTIGQVVSKQFDLPRGDLFDNVLMTEDGRHLVTLQRDGSFFVNRLSNAQPVLSGLYADDEVIVWSDDGRYDATSEGAYFVSYTFPGHFGEYTAQQFENYLKVPGLVQQVRLGVYKPSTVQITPPPILRASVEVTDTQAVLKAEAQAPVALRALTVFQDGLRTQDFAADGPVSDWQETIDLLPGTRWLSLVATDVNGVASAPYSVEIPQPAAARRLHVFAIGVDDYGDASLNLTAAVGDARLFASALADRADDGVRIASQTVLLDAEATPDRILSELETLVQTAHPGDTVALYFAGHGLSVDGRYYLAAAGVDVDNISGTALPFDALSARLRDADLRIALFIDACHSGLAGDGLFSTNDQVVGGALDQIPSGLVVFAAAKGREFSLEDPETAQGFFAQALAEVLHDPARDLNGNGAVELSELFRGTKQLVSDRVQQAQQGAAPADLLTQTPWMARNLMVGDFALF
ncbi:caspase domain protein [Antarctobacter heliothermus]|uniref:Caspase domain protein n=1 Tax=Antarctobacter heliothermus TaxID=74033 RepID=A0A222DZN6_9RHOB|nr:caspase family protein [Antarctobacter heliothermus]ASP19455.1 caspase domain protein [Antarctobacter heliothermus]